MGNRRLDAKAFGLMAALLVLTGAVLLWIRRRSSTDHDVSDPGVTL
jgi:nitrate reductase gamma subunit